MPSVLLRALRTIAKADSDPARQLLFLNLVQSSRWTRTIYALHRLSVGTPFSGLMVLAYAAGQLAGVTPPRASRVPIATLAKHANAVRNVNRVVAWLGAHRCAAVRPTVSAAGLGGLLRQLLSAPRDLRRISRLAGRLDRRYGFLVACRTAATVAWYTRSRTLLMRRGVQAVLVSSDTNPEEAGFTAAARALGLKRLFVSHAYPTPLSPPLDFDLSILEGPAALAHRQRRGAVRGAVVFGGVEGGWSPLQTARLDVPAPVVGVFTPKAIATTTLAEVLRECRAHLHASRIVIRWHPSRLDGVRLWRVVDDVSHIEESDPAEPLATVAQRCDLVIADENSNVHLQVLKLGIPTIAVEGLGVYPRSHTDQYGFAAAGVVFPPVRSLASVRLEEVKAFFTDAWASRFRQHDAAYLRAESELAAEVTAAVDGLLAPAVEPRGR